MAGGRVLAAGLRQDAAGRHVEVAGGRVDHLWRKLRLRIS
jgi:hypothetical protein